MPLLFLNSDNLPCLSGKRDKRHCSRLICSASNPGRVCSGDFSLSRKNVKRANSFKLLTLSDHAVLGPIRENPHAAEANRVTKRICKEHHIYVPGFNKYYTMASFIYPRTSKDRLIALNLWFCLLFFLDDVYECSLPREYVDDPQGFGQYLETAVRVLCGDYEPEEGRGVYALCREINTRLRQLCGSQWIQHFRYSCLEHMRAFLDMRNIGISEHISVDSYMDLRLHDSGMVPTIDAIDIAWNIAVHDEIVQNEQIQEMVLYAKRIGWLSNDVFSYQKEVLELGLRFNFLNIVMENYNVSWEEAVHEAIWIVNSDTARFVELEKNLPIWEDEEINHTARCYV